MNYRPLTNDETHSVRVLIEAQKDERRVLEKKLELVGVADRLAENEDFIKLFEDYYFKDEAVRVTSILPTRNSLNEADRMDLMDTLISIGKTQAWFNDIKSSRIQLENDLEGIAISLKEAINVSAYGVGEDY